MMSKKFLACDFKLQPFYLHNAICCNINGELQRENKSISYERAFKMLENDMYIVGIGQAVLELLSLQIESGNHQKGNHLTSEIFGHLR